MNSDRVMDDKDYGEIFYTLNLDNLQETAERIERFLRGKRYVFVAANEAIYNFKPRIHMGQKLNDKNPMSIWFDEKNDPPRHGGFNFGDSYGVWGLSTSQKDEKYDPKFDSPYIVFRYGHTIEITHRAPAGHLLYWVIAVEDDDER